MSNHHSLNDLLEEHSGGAHAEDGEGNWLVSYADMMTLFVGFFVILLSFSTVNEGDFEKVKQSVAKEFGGSYEIPFADLGEKIKNEINKMGLGNQFSIKVLPDGIEISFLGTIFFASGSADLKSEAKVMLEKLYPVIKSEKIDFNIMIEGHTDDNPISEGFFVHDNFELSSIRACRVLDVFVKGGFQKEKMTAVGYGEARPIVKNRDGKGNPIPLNQSQNRRVVIKLSKNSEGALIKPVNDSKESVPESH